MEKDLPDAASGSPSDDSRYAGAADEADWPESLLDPPAVPGTDRSVPESGTKPETTRERRKKRKAKKAEVQTPKDLWDEPTGADPQRQMESESLPFDSTWTDAHRWAMESWPTLFPNLDVAELESEKLRAKLPPWAMSAAPGADLWWHWLFHCSALALGEEYEPRVA